MSLVLNNMEDAEYGLNLEDYAPEGEDEETCKSTVLLLFPKLCREYLARLMEEHAHQSVAIIRAILDAEEQGHRYPTQKPALSLSRKRKRTDGDDAAEHGEGKDAGHDKGKGDGDGHDGNNGAVRDPESVRAIRRQIRAPLYDQTTRRDDYIMMAKQLLGHEFPWVSLVTINWALRQNNWILFDTYAAIDEALRSGLDGDKLWKPKKTPNKKFVEFEPEMIDELDWNQYEEAQIAAINEFNAARELQAAKDAQRARIEADRAAREAAEAKERQEFQEAKDNNMTCECETCYDEFIITNMVPCDGDPLHYFCRNCLKLQAESQVGMNRFEMKCMSTQGCSAGFSPTSRALFLDARLTQALETLELQASLRMAGLEDLETCPLCPYAAVYPPIEENKEFRCENPECQEVTCRLCRKPTHIPKTCAEADRDRGHDARHILEEAMSSALIRKCNKCQNPFVKDGGCNKIVCSVCGTLQCDVCRQTVSSYLHFKDETNSRLVGTCPLYDKNEEQRHHNEVKKAEEDTRKKVVEENPDLDEEWLRFKTAQGIDTEPAPGPVPLVRPVPNGFVIPGPYGPFAHPPNDRMAARVRYPMFVPPWQLPWAQPPGMPFVEGPFPGIPHVPLQPPWLPYVEGEPPVVAHEEVPQESNEEDADQDDDDDDDDDDNYDDDEDDEYEDE